jgi:hypothetical protein
MLKVEGNPLSEKLRTIVGNLKISSDKDPTPEHLIKHLNKDDKKRIYDFIDIIATKEKEIKEKEVPASAPAISSSSSNHESDNRVAKKQRVGEGARSD